MITSVKEVCTFIFPLFMFFKKENIFLKIKTELRASLFIEKRILCFFVLSNNGTNDGRRLWKLLHIYPPLPLFTPMLPSLLQETKGLTRWLWFSSKPSFSANHWSSSPTPIYSNPQVLAESLLQVWTSPPSPHLQCPCNLCFLGFCGIRDLQGTWCEHLFSRKPPNRWVPLGRIFRVLHRSLWRLLEVHEEGNGHENARTAGTREVTRHPCRWDRTVLHESVW